MLPVISRLTLAFNHTLNAFAPNMTAGEANILVVGRAGSTKNSAYVGFTYSSAGSNDNYLTFGHWASDHLLRLHGDGKLNLQTGYFQVGGQTVIDSSRNVTTPNVYLNDTSTRLHEGGGNALRIETGTGYIDIGSMNSGFIHFQGNKPYYFDQHMYIDKNLYPYSTTGYRDIGGTSNIWNHVYAKGYFIDSNEIINASREIKNVPRIFFNSGLQAVDLNNADSLILDTPDGHSALLLSGGSYDTNYYSNETHYFRGTDVLDIHAIIDTTGIKSFGDYKVGGTTVIDASRTHFSGIKGYATTATGTTSITASTGIKQTYAEGWTAIFADFEPHHEWGLYHDNPSNKFIVSAGSSTNNIYSFSVVNHSGATRTAYAKIILDQSSGLVSSGGGYSVGTSTVIDASRNLENIVSASIRGDIDTRTPQGTTQTDKLKFGINNGNAAGTSDTIGGGIEWSPLYGGYSKRSAAILAIGEGNYFRAGLAFYTNNTANASTDYSERMRLTMEGNLNLVSGSLTMGGTTVIDSSKNLTNIGSITATSNSGIGIAPNNQKLVVGGTAQTRVQIDGSSNSGLYFTVGGANGATIRSASVNNLQFYTTGLAATIDSSMNFNISSGGLQFGGTQVIDSSRNIFVVNASVENVFNNGASLWYTSSSDRSHQRADARSDGSSSTFSRLHWYGVHHNQATSNFRHAWYDGSSYINVTAAAGTVTFTGAITSTGNIASNGSGFSVGTTAVRLINCPFVSGNVG